MHLRRELIVASPRTSSGSSAFTPAPSPPDPSSPQGLFARRLRRDDDEVQRLVKEWLDALATLPVQEPPAPGQKVEVGIIEMTIWTDCHNQAVTHLESRGWTIKKAAIMTKANRSGVARRRKGWRVTFSWVNPKPRPQVAAWPFPTN